MAKKLTITALPKEWQDRLEFARGYCAAKPGEWFLWAGPGPVRSIFDDGEVYAGMEFRGFVGPAGYVTACRPAPDAS